MRNDPSDRNTISERDRAQSDPNHEEGGPAGRDRNLGIVAAYGLFASVVSFLVLAWDRAEHSVVDYPQESGERTLAWSIWIGMLVLVLLIPTSFGVAFPSPGRDSRWAGVEYLPLVLGLFWGCMSPQVDWLWHSEASWTFGIYAGAAVSHALLVQAAISDLIRKEWAWLALEVLVLLLAAGLVLVVTTAILFIE